MSSVELPRQWKWGSVPEEILNSNLNTYTKLLIAAITYHSFGNGPAWPGTERLAKLCSCSKRVIFRAIKELEQTGYLVVNRAKGQVNIYKFLTKTGVPESPVDQEAEKPVTVGHPVSLKPVTQGNTNETLTSNEKPSSAVAEPSQSKEFIQWWTEQFEAKFKSKYLFQGGKDGMAVKRLLTAFSLDELKAKVVMGWDMADRKDFSVRTICMTISGFSSMVNQLANKGTGVIAGVQNYIYDPQSGEKWLVDGKWTNVRPQGWNRQEWENKRRKL